MAGQTYTSFEQWARKMNRIGDAIPKACTHWTQKTAIAVGWTLIDNTPEDKGYAEGNWIPSIDAPVLNPVGMKAGDTWHQDPSYYPNPQAGITQSREALKRIVGKFNATINNSIYICNNVGYIIMLNNGWSKQAPRFFVEKSLRNPILKGMTKKAIMAEISKEMLGLLGSQNVAIEGRQASDFNVAY